MRLIDAGKAKVLLDWTLIGDAADAACRVIDNVPTVDAVEVVHGKWENGNPICPVCGENKFRGLDADIWCDWQPDFCPNCGAKMDGVDDG